MSKEIFYGAQEVMNVSIEPIDGLTMAEYDFKVSLTALGISAKIKTYAKEELLKVDNNNYELRLDTTDIGLGKVWCKIEATLPDNRFEARKRTMIAEFDTGYEIVKGRVV